MMELTISVLEANHTFLRDIREPSEAKVRDRPTDIFELALHDTAINSPLTTTKLRGGMIEEEQENQDIDNVDDVDDVDDESHTPTLFSHNYPEYLQGLRTASGVTSTLCTDDIPDPDPVPDTADGHIAQPMPMRRVTSATSVHALSTVLVTEPHQVVLSRAVAEEDAERTGGVVATNSTPVQGLMQNLGGDNSNLAEYVERRFNLDGGADRPGNSNSVNSQPITFREPDYGNTGTQEVIIADDEVEAELNRSNSRRLSAAVRNARSRLREFFPASDVVTSSRASMEGSTSGPRPSPPLRRTASEHNLLDRVAGRLFQRDEPEQSSTRTGATSLDGTPVLRDEGRLLGPWQRQQVPISQDTLPLPVETERTSLDREAAPEPVLDQTHRDTVAPANFWARRNSPVAGQTTDDVADPDIRTERQASATSLMRRAMHRLSTTFTFGSPFGSRDDTNAPPPTRDGPSISESDEHSDAGTQQDQPGTHTRASRLGTKLRYVGSSTLDLARRAASRFSDAPDGDMQTSRGNAHGSMKYSSSTNFDRRLLRGPIERIERIRAARSRTVPTGGDLEPVIPEGSRPTNQREPSSETVDNAVGRRPNRARRSIFPEWWNTFRRATAPIRRRDTPHGHASPRAVGPKEPESRNANNEETAPRTSPAGANMQAKSSHQAAQKGSDASQQPKATWKQSIAQAVRSVGQGQQNVFVM